jgi:hypothetical protein
MFKPLYLFSVSVLFFFSAYLVKAQIPQKHSAVESVAIPGIKTWEENMIKYGKKQMKEKEINILTEQGSERFVWYYDGQRVFYQIADYTGDSQWHQFAAEKMNNYRNYIFELERKVQGWRVFPHGLYMDFQRTGDKKSKEAALFISRNSAFASTGGGSDEKLSRETAYCINSYLVAEALGEPRNEKLTQAVEYALGHIDQWFVQNSSGNWAPFMFGLTCEALISYYQQIEKDPRIIRAIKLGLDACWERAWIEEKQAFFYRANNPGNAAPTLNLLIAPAYAWMYLQTGDVTYRDRGDKIFEGGVHKAYLDGGKQFSQNYRWSFDYIKWRTEADQIRLK